VGHATIGLPLTLRIKRKGRLAEAWRNVSLCPKKRSVSVELRSRSIVSRLDDEAENTGKPHVSDVIPLAPTCVVS